MPDRSGAGWDMDISPPVRAAPPLKPETLRPRALCLCCRLLAARRRDVHASPGRLTTVGGRSAFFRSLSASSGLAGGSWRSERWRRPCSKLGCLLSRRVRLQWRRRARTRDFGPLTRWKRRATASRASATSTSLRRSICCSKILCCSKEIEHLQGARYWSRSIGAWSGRSRILFEASGAAGGSVERELRLQA